MNKHTWNNLAESTKEYMRYALNEQISGGAGGAWTDQFINQGGRGPGLIDGDPPTGMATFDKPYTWPDGTTLWPDGTSTFPDGTAYWPDGTTLWPDGTSTFPNTQPIA